MLVFSRQRRREIFLERVILHRCIGSPAFSEVACPRRATAQADVYNYFYVRKHFHTFVIVLVT